MGRGEGGGISREAGTRGAPGGWFGSGSCPEEDGGRDEGPQLPCSLLPEPAMPMDREIPWAGSHPAPHLGVSGHYRPAHGSTGWIRNSPEISSTRPSVSLSSSASCSRLAQLQRRSPRQCWSLCQGHGGNRSGVNAESRECQRPNHPACPQHMQTHTARTPTLQRDPEHPAQPHPASGLWPQTH